MVKTSAMMVAAATAVFWTLGGAISAPIAAADSGETVTTLGQPAEIVNGAVVQAWTISALKPSADVIPYAVRGTLWEAAAADTALQGEVTPIVPNLSARARNGDTYPVLWTVATPQGVNSASLGPGQTTAGKIYFDVTGQDPDSVLYSDGARDLALWVQPPPQPAAAGGIGSATAAYPPAASTAGPAEAGDAALLPAGSQGTPLPFGSQGTPAGTPAAAAASEGTPAAAATEGTPAAAPAGSQGTPVAGSPAPAASEGTPAPTPAPTQGTQSATVEGTPAAPATPVVPHGS